VQIIGGSRRQLRITLDPTRIAAFGLAPARRGRRFCRRRTTSIPALPAR